MKIKYSILLIRILVFLLSLELTLNLAGLILKYSLELRNTNSIRNNSSFIILTLGESTTYGGGKNAWPYQLETILNNSNLGYKYSVINKGIPGIKTSTIVSHLPNYLSQFKPDMVIAMTGIMDNISGVNLDKRFALSEIKSTDNLFVSIVKNLKTYKLVKLIIYSFNIQNSSPNNFSSAKQAEEKYKKQIETNPKDDQAFVELGNLYIYTNNQNAESMYLKAIEVNPQNYHAYIGLGNLYPYLKKIKRAEEMYRVAIKINPHSDYAYMMFGEFLISSKRYKEAEEMFKQAITINKANIWVYFDLAEVLHRHLKKYEAAEVFYKQYIELAIENTRGLVGLSQLYRKVGRLSEADEYEKKVLQKSQQLNMTTASNYRKIKEIISQKGIKLVAVQYPLLDPELLKQTLYYDDEVIFVENQRNFEEALLSASYEEYFTDRFAGVFGHATVKGNHLIAKNIADALIRNYFAEKTVK